VNRSTNEFVGERQKVKYLIFRTYNADMWVSQQRKLCWEFYLDIVFELLACHVWTRITVWTQPTLHYNDIWERGRLE